MAAYVKYELGIEKMMEAGNAGTDTWQLILSNTAPNVATHTTAVSATELSTGGGYTAGGVNCTITSAVSTSGVYKLILAALGSAKEIEQNRSALDKDKVAFEDYRMRIQAGLDDLKQDLVEQAKTVAKQEQELAAEQAELGTLIASSKEVVAAKEKQLAALEKKAASAETKVAKAMSEIEKAHQALEARENACLAREADVEKKLAIIKSLG